MEHCNRAKGPHLAVLNLDFSKSYAENAFSGSVTAVDYWTVQVIKQIPTGARTEGISHYGRMEMCCLYW
jgi:hypothetical protein